MTDYDKNYKSNSYSNLNKKYYDSTNREQRLEARKNAKCTVSLWNDSDSEEETVEETFRNFFKSNNYLDNQVYRAKNNLNSKKNEVYEPSVDNIQIEEHFNDNKYNLQKAEADFIAPMNINSSDAKKEYLNKKTNRDSEPIKTSQKAHVSETGEIEFEKDKDKRAKHATSSEKVEQQLFAQYVQQGKRIPRRGEVGISSDDIEKFESLGYVMSGNRHKKMTLVRLKKEQQVYTAEEKRALAIYNFQEQQRRDSIIMNEMKYMWENKRKEDENEIEEGFIAEEKEVEDVSENEGEDFLMEKNI